MDTVRGGGATHDIGREMWMVDLIKILYMHHEILKQLQPYKYLREICLKTMSQLYNTWSPSWSVLTDNLTSSGSFLSVFTGTWHSSLAGACSCLKQSRVLRLVEHKIHIGIPLDDWHIMLGKNKGLARDISLGVVELLLITCVALESYLTFLHLVFPLKNKTGKQTKMLVIAMQLPSVLWKWMTKNSAEHLKIARA